MRVLAWLLATACAAHAGEATEAASATTDQFKLLIGSVLMSDYIFRGISYSAHQPAVGTYIDAQQGWLYVYTNFNSVRFSTNPAGELTMAVGARPTLGPFEFDIGAEYYYYPGEIGPEHSNYWEGHATVSHKLTDKITWGSTLAYAPDVWQTGAWGTYAGGTLSFDLPSEFVPAEVSWSLSMDVGRWLFGPTSSGGGVSAAGGGLPLPDFTNWHAGLTFTYRVILRRSAVDEKLHSFFPQGIDAPGAGAGEGQIKEHKAEQDREIAAIEDGQETARGMSEKIGKCHLTGENECNRTGEEAQYHQRTAHQLERSGKAIERKQRHILERRHGRKFQQLRHSILQE